MARRRQKENSFGNRIIAAKVIAFLGLAVLGVRLWYLQCLHGNYYRDLSENNRSRTIRTQAPRGIIYDRFGRIIVRNRPAFQIALMLEDTPNVAETVSEIAQITGRDPEALLRRFESERRSRRFEPKVVLHDVSREELAQVKANTHKLPGMIVSAVPTRAYPHGGLASQLIGYTREISRRQLDTMKEAGYHMGDTIGQSGLEKEFEPALRGEAGYTRVEVDARGARRGELGIVDHRPGGNIYLSIDLDLQQAAERALEGKRGAVVAVKPQTGEVLAIASSPNFDVSMFSGPMPAGAWESLVKDRYKPLTNRAISSIYPPGSTFKLLTAIAALAEKKVTPQTEFYCPGWYRFGGRRYHCHRSSGHGNVNLHEAITLSCNVYFYQVGQLLEIDLMSKYFQWFGLGQKTGIPLAGEVSGTSPSREWKIRQFGERWYPGDTLPVSIGQGYIVVTPIQMAMLTATIANGGTLYRPMLVRKVVHPETGETQEFEPEAVREIPVDEEVFELVRTYAASVVNAPRGTGRRARLEGITVAGKTGTAQVAALGRAADDEFLKHHAWFVAFAPSSEPQIAMSVVVENAGGGGGLFAAPVAQEVLDTFFRKRGMLPVEPDEEQETAPSVVPVNTETEEREVTPEPESEIGTPPAPQPIGRRAGATSVPQAPQPIIRTERAA